MLVNSIKLNNYRNYKNKLISLSPTLNIIIGKNGVGKTNILESIIVISNTKSFRTNKDQELIKKNSEYSRIEINSDVGILKIVINNEGKSLFINDEAIKKTSEYIGKINAVLFKPSDLELFNTSPKERRRLIDTEVSKISKIYLDNLLIYNKLLKDKNILLKDENLDTNYLDVIDSKMVNNIKDIINIRLEFFKNINLYISDIYNQISGSSDKIEIIYNKCSDVDFIQDNLFISREKDLIYKYATFGPHHDDFYFKFNDYELNSVASQGQKRMVFISFKFALVKYIKDITNKNPIILLDDVLSELDITNRERLLNILPCDSQIIITDTDLNGINIKKKFNLIELKEEENG